MNQLIGDLNVSGKISIENKLIVKFAMKHQENSLLSQIGAEI